MEILCMLRGWKAGVLLAMIPCQAGAWGFVPHEDINEQAVYALPASLFPFYRELLLQIRQRATQADKRCYAVAGEKQHHYIDMEAYELPAGRRLAEREATELYGSSFLEAHGDLPWHIMRVKKRLTAAFRRQDLAAILRLSADLGHYIADAHVPLHTSANYDGQLTGQEGIHAFWETRLPALFSHTYDFFSGEQASYLPDPAKAAWAAIWQAHNLSQRLLKLHREVRDAYPAAWQYAYERKGNSLRKLQSRPYSALYHQQLAGMVEEQMLGSVRLLASFWYTCWVDAGSPALPSLRNIEPDEWEEWPEEQEG